MDDNRELMMMIDGADNTGLVDPSMMNLENYDQYNSPFNDDEYDDYGDDDDERGLMIGGSGGDGGRPRRGKSFHHSARGGVHALAQQKRLKIYYALMLAFIVFVVVSMVIVAVRVLNTYDNGGGGGGAEKKENKENEKNVNNNNDSSLLSQTSIKLTWSPSPCFISNGSLADNCALPQNSFKVPSYEQGWIISELKLAMENGAINDLRKEQQKKKEKKTDVAITCKENGVKFDASQLSKETVIELKKYWPSLSSSTFETDIWKRSYEDHGSCLPTVFPVSDDKSFDQETFFKRALSLRSQLAQRLMNKMKNSGKSGVLKSGGEASVRKDGSQFPVETISYDSLTQQLLTIPVDPSVAAFSVPVKEVTGKSECQTARDQTVFQSVVFCVNSKTGVLEKCNAEYGTYLDNFDARCRSAQLTLPLKIVN